MNEDGVGRQRLGRLVVALGMAVPVGDQSHPAGLQPMLTDMHGRSPLFAGDSVDAGSHLTDQRSVGKSFLLVDDIQVRFDLPVILFHINKFKNDMHKFKDAME